MGSGAVELLCSLCSWPARAVWLPLLKLYLSNRSRRLSARKLVHIALSACPDACVHPRRIATPPPPTISWRQLTKEFSLSSYTEQRPTVLGPDRSWCRSPVFDGRRRRKNINQRVLFMVSLKMQSEVPWVDCSCLSNEASVSSSEVQNGKWISSGKDCGMFFFFPPNVLIN